MTRTSGNIPRVTQEEVRGHSDVTNESNEALSMSNDKLHFIERSSGKRRHDLKRLIAYCNDADAEVRMRAIERLRATKSFDRPDVFMLSAGDPDELVRIEALQALAVRQYAKEFLPSLVSALSDSSELVSAYAADGLRVAARKSCFCALGNARRNRTMKGVDEYPDRVGVWEEIEEESG